MATMPSRFDTAPRAIAFVLSQVVRLWLFLDRFDTVPSYAMHQRIRVVRSQDLGAMTANGKLVGVALDEEPSLFFSVEDVIEYPPEYFETLEANSRRWS